MKKIVLLFLLSFCSTISVAATWTDGTQLSKHIMWRKSIKGVYVHSSTYDNPDNCSGSSSLYVLDESLDETYKNQILSILLNANTVKKPIHLFVEGCINGYPKMTGIQLNP